MTETEDKPTPYWKQRLKTIWAGYLQIGTVMAILGAFGLWIWLMTLWGLWGFFLGWIPAALTGFLLLRFIWLPALITGLFLLLEALPGGTESLVLKGVLMAIIWGVVAERLQKKVKDKTDG